MEELNEKLRGYLLKTIFAYLKDPPEGSSVQYKSLAQHQRLVGKRSNKPEKLLTQYGKPIRGKVDRYKRFTLDYPPNEREEIVDLVEKRYIALIPGYTFWYQITKRGLNAAAKYIWQLHQNNQKSIVMRLGMSQELLNLIQISSEGCQTLIKYQEERKRGKNTT